MVVCIDGSEPDYIEQAIAAGVMPGMADRARRLSEGGLRHAEFHQSQQPLDRHRATACVVHGIAGNFFLERETEEKVMMNDPKFLRCTHHLFRSRRQARRSQWSRLRTSCASRSATASDWAMAAMAAPSAFSSERADEVTLAEHGIENVLELVGQPLPDVYSAELSGFVMAAGVEIARRKKPDLMYLSTTDYIQHKYAPGSQGANAFYAMMDAPIGALDALGCTLVMVADHGMNAKHKADGSPDVIYLQDVLDDWLGEGRAEVICPITDPYVVHHGALGSFVTVYLDPSVDADALVDRLATLDGIDTVLSRGRAATALELPEDRIGDLVVTSTQNVVIGAAEVAHDLSGLDAPLRSHGGFTEQTVPFMTNRPVIGLDDKRQLRNFDAFDVALNHVEVRS
ncbi:MAG: phosphonoacetate hydrolase [Alphaproteobacteria bacterium]